VRRHLLLFFLIRARRARATIATPTNKGGEGITEGGLPAIPVLTYLSQKADLPNPRRKFLTEKPKVVEEERTLRGRTRSASFFRFRTHVTPSGANHGRSTLFFRSEQCEL